MEYFIFSFPWSLCSRISTNAVMAAYFDLFNFTSMHRNGCTVSIPEIVFPFDSFCFREMGTKKCIFHKTSPALHPIHLTHLTFQLCCYYPAEQKKNMLFPFLKFCLHRKWKCATKVLEYVHATTLKFLRHVDILYIAACKPRRRETACSTLRKWLAFNRTSLYTCRQAGKLNAPTD